MSIITSKLIYENKKIIIPDNRLDSIVTIDGAEYQVSLLSPIGNKGGNSFVFKLYDVQEEDEIIDEGLDPVAVIKVSKYYDKLSLKKLSEVCPSSNNNKKFEREINALFQCKKDNIENIVNIWNSGHLEIKDSYEKYYYFPFYVMDYAKYDLKTYFDGDDYQNELDYSNKISLCLDLAKGILSLHKLGYYHRDIKPDNIFFINNSWKIGDLGLVSFRNRDNDELYRSNEFIGPRGWISPEAMNRYLTIGTKVEKNFNSKIDDASDVFQLGKVFWYIMQGNAPIGCVDETDYLHIDKEMYNIIKKMLIHSKNERLKLNDVISYIEKLLDK